MAEPGQGCGYQVTIGGEVGPVLGAALRDLGAVRTTYSSLVTVCPRAEEDLVDLLDLLEQRGHVVLGIRVLPSEDVPTATAGPT